MTHQPHRPGSSRHSGWQTCYSATCSLYRRGVSWNPKRVKRLAQNPLLARDRNGPNLQSFNQLSYFGIYRTKTLYNVAHQKKFQKRNNSIPRSVTYLWVTFGKDLPITLNYRVIAMYVLYLFHKVAVTIE